MDDILVIIVDKKDHPLGLMSKSEAHRKGILHRAVSVFIFNSSGQWLLQRRAENKYHSGGLWTNTCCSHPLPGETNIDAAARRLMEEMGMSCQLKENFNFIYKVPVNNELTEHELDFIFSGISDISPTINPNEVSDYKYISYNELKTDIKDHPENYSPWFRLIFERVFNTVFQNNIQITEAGLKADTPD